MNLSRIRSPIRQFTPIRKTLQGLQILEDPSSGKLFPLDQNSFVALGIAPPRSIWPMQDIGGNLLDECGGIMLSAQGLAAGSYRANAAGMARKGIAFTQTSSQRAGFPNLFLFNPEEESCALLLITTLDVPAGTRDIMGINLSSTHSHKVRYAANGLLQLFVDGVTSTGAISHATGTPHALLEIHNFTTPGARVITELETIEGTPGVVEESETTPRGFGALDGATSYAGVGVYGCAWGGVNAETLSRATLTAMRWT